jgi:transposase
MSAFRWTTLTPERLSEKLAERDISASPSAVRRLLAGMGFTLQGNHTTARGKLEAEATVSGEL